MKRSVFALLFAGVLIASGIGAAAQEGPRAAPSNNNLNFAQDVFLDMNPATLSTFAVPNMAEADLQAGELVHTCGTDNSTGSVWYEFSSVGGQVVIDTSGSNIDTIMTLYQGAALANPAYLDAVACAETGTGGAVQARMSVHVPAGSYVLQVGNNDPIKPPDAALSISFSFDPDSDLKAPGDNLAKAKPVKFGKRVTIANIAYATTEAGEVNPSCESLGAIRSTVWLTFDAVLAGELSANMLGSAFEGSIYQMIMAVYREDTPGVLTEILCEAGTTVQFDAPSVLNAPITPGKHFIQLGLSTTLNAQPDSRFMFSAGIDLRPTTLQSGNFDGDNSKWTVIGGDSGSAIEPEPVGSALDGNVFACRPPSSGKTALKQKVNLGGLRFKSEMMFQLNYKLTASVADHYTIPLQITVKYADGTASKVTRKLVVIVGGGFTSGGFTIPIQPGAMTSATLKIQCTPPAGQTLYFDDLALALWAMTPYRDAGGVLPLPAAHGGR